LIGLSSERCSAFAENRVGSVRCGRPCQGLGAEHFEAEVGTVRGAENDEQPSHESLAGPPLMVDFW
jgi:hypothetical protein